MMVAIIPSTVTATTFADLIEEIITKLQSFVRDQEKSSHLEAAVTSSGLTLTVPSGTKLSAGIVEVDYELMWVESVDQTSGTLTVAPYGRGWAGTTAAAHDQNARITFNPRFPKLQVARAVNDTIAAVGLKVPAIQTTTLTASAAVISYELPATTKRVLSMSWEAPGATEGWVPIRRYDIDQKANTTAFASGVSVSIFDGVQPGQTIQVVYATDPDGLFNDDDTFSETGLPDSLIDVVVYGAVARLTGFGDAGRLDYKSLSADQFDDPTPVGSAAAMSRYFYQLYSVRLAEEAMEFNSKYATRLRWTR